MKCDVCGSEMTQMIMSSFCGHCEAKSLPQAAIQPPIGTLPGAFSMGVAPTSLPPPTTANTTFNGAKTWDFNSAVLACRKIEVVVETFGFHVALSGGTLYKLGIRKDVDIWIYPHTVDRSRMLNRTETDYMANMVANIFSTTSTRASSKCYNDGKIVYKLGNNIDLFFPYTDF